MLMIKYHPKQEYKLHLENLIIMQKHLNIIALLTLLTVGLSAPASATLLLTTYGSGVATPSTIGGYAMTDFAVTNIGGGTGGNTSNVASPISGMLEFIDISNASATLGRNLADSVAWWNNGESNNYDIFTTSLHLVTIILPTNTYAFSFNVGANLSTTRNNAWLTATETNGAGISSRYNFNVNRTNTPGFGIYVDNSNGNCSTLSSVTIDPHYWGVGNFSINQNPTSCEVPEPPSLALIALGLVGFRIAQRRVAQHKVKT